MTKKILFVLVLVFSVFSIILIAVWGTLPENSNNIQVETIVINEYDETNDNGDKFINVTDIISKENNIFTINYVIGPENANADIVVSTTDKDVNLQVDQLDNKVYVIYSFNAIDQMKTITVQIKDKDTQNFDEVTLWFKTPGVIIVPEI
ncbi:MAG: hypothetical protein WC152_04465 [Candidatus Izemoplasmatales bacterium]